MGIRKYKQTVFMKNSGKWSTEYDCMSILQYPEYVDEFAIEDHKKMLEFKVDNGCPLKRKLVEVSEYFSELDIFAINRKYLCPR